MSACTNVARLCSLLAGAILLALAAVASSTASGAEGELSHDQALNSLRLESAQARLAGAVRLGEIGIMSDVEALLKTLHDEDETTRDEAQRSILRIWSRSGDNAIDSMLTRGVREMSEGNIARSLSTFNEIIARKPEFAEGWNKRATLYFLTGDYLKSMQDCDEVLKRNPHHFGALAGYGQIQLHLQNYERALDYFQRALNINPNLISISNTMDRLERMIHRRKDGQI